MLTGHVKLEIYSDLNHLHPINTSSREYKYRDKDKFFFDLIHGSIDTERWNMSSRWALLSSLV